MTTLTPAPTTKKRERFATAQDRSSPPRRASLGRDDRAVRAIRRQRLRRKDSAAEVAPAAAAERREAADDGTAGHRRLGERRRWRARAGLCYR